MGEACIPISAENLRRTTIKPISIITLAVLALALVACGSTADIPAASKTPVSSESDDPPAQTGQDQAAEQECPQLSPHPVAANIAETFEVEYQEVIEWFCGGQTFDEILLALQTAEIAEVEVQILFEGRADGKSWDQIWNELGITAP